MLYYFINPVSFDPNNFLNGGTNQSIKFFDTGRDCWDNFILQSINYFITTKSKPINSIVTNNNGTPTTNIPPAGCTDAQYVQFLINTSQLNISSATGTDPNYNYPNKACYAVDISSVTVTRV